MILLLHIIIAITTIGLSGFTLISPTRKKLNASYIFTIVTFATGTYLIIMKPAHLVTSCITGLIFLGIVGTLLAIAKTRLAVENS